MIVPKEKWAENHVKLEHVKRVLRNGNLPLTVENLMFEYIRQGGRIIHPKTGEVLDNTYGAEWAEEIVGEGTAERMGRTVVERDYEAIKERIPEFAEAYGTKKPKKAAHSNSEAA